MKHLKAKETVWRGQKVITMEMKDLVPCSLYEQIPDYETLKTIIGTGEMEYPLLVYQSDQEYYTVQHLANYKSGSPGLPETAPEIEVDVRLPNNQTKKANRIHIVWSGRQRYQVAKELGYTHIDVIVQPDFFQMVAWAGAFRDITENTKGFKKKK